MTELLNFLVIPFVTTIPEALIVIIFISLLSVGETNLKRAIILGFVLGYIFGIIPVFYADIEISFYRTIYSLSCILCIYIINIKKCKLLDIIFNFFFVYIVMGCVEIFIVATCLILNYITLDDITKNLIKIISLSIPCRVLQIYALVILWNTKREFSLMVYELTTGGIK